MVHVIKVYLEDSNNEKQIRRLAVGSDIVSSFILLKERIRDLFELPNCNFELKWKDSENDFILMSSDGELAQALANAEDGLLRLFVCLYSAYLSKKENEPVASQEPQNNGEEHPMVVCDGCDQNVYGVRYKCLQCRNYDLCTSCNKANRHPYHDMIKLIRPAYVPRDWAFWGSRRLWRSMFGRCPKNYFPSCSATNDVSSSDDSPNASPEQGPCKDAFSQFLNGNFVSAQKLISDGLCNFLENWPGGIDLKIENPPFKPQNSETKMEKETNMDAKDEEMEVQTTPDQTIVQNELPILATKEEKADVQPKCEEVTEPKTLSDVCGLFTNNLKMSPEVNLVEPMKPFVEPMKTENEIKSSDSNEREKSPADDEASSFAEGWTFLQEDEAHKLEASAVKTDKNELEKVVINPSLSQSEVIQENPIEVAQPNQVASPNQGQNCHYMKDGSTVQTNDPIIINALIKMQAMGFTNEGGWLERLLITKKGNINEALDALYPFTQQRH